jgi:hypothetical protein
MMMMVMMVTFMIVTLAVHSMYQFTCDYFYLQKRNTKSVAPDGAGKPTGFLNNATEHGNSSASDDDGKTIKTSGVV